MKYTVKSFAPTGKNDPTYGTEYVVHFNEDDREVKMSRVKPISEGQEENGQIINGKFGAYFKKDAYNPNQAPASQPNTSSALPKEAKPVWKDNQDGQKQGMCINNAANYVNAQYEAGKPLRASEWAEAVHGYASELYALGDLQPPVVGDLSDAPKNVQELLG